MLKIRDKIKPYVFYEVGNGNSISAWYDKWCDQGPLNRFITNRDIYDARLKNDAKLSDLICNGNWIWPDEWGDDFPELNQLAVPNLNQRDDRVKWVDNNNNKGDYSTRNAWLSLRINWPKVSWNNVVWFSQCNPKQAFILWMAVQKKLLTQDRMHWIQGNDLKCALCNKCSDSHGHLFFECKYSKKIWNAIAAKGRFTDSGDNLETVVKKLETSTTKNNMWLIVDKFIVSASVYFIWNERNKRNFQQVNRTEEDLVKTITRNIEEMLMSLKVKRSNSVLKVASTWDLSYLDGKLIHAIADSSSTGLVQIT
ncbi:RNA-directed DNA polymerase, eukaryota, reverse transcriptase zinc-binding domain protein [Tanacetum coccineum]